MSGEISLGVHPDVINSASTAPSVGPENNPRDTVEAKLAKLSRQERDANFVGVGMGILRKDLDEGRYDSNPPLKEKAKKGISYDGSNGVTKESSDQLKALVEVLLESKNEDGTKNEGAQRCVDEFSPDLRMSVTVDGKVELFTLGQWKIKLETATPEEKTNLEEKGRLAFYFHKEEENQAQISKEKSGEDLVISTQISTLTQEIVAAKVRGEDTRAQEHLLVTLHLAERADGELGGLLKLRALQNLEQSGIKGLHETIVRLQDETQAAEAKLAEVLKSSGLSDQQIEEIKKAGGIEVLIQNGSLPEIKGLSELVFGKELTEQDFINIMTTKMSAEQAQEFWNKHKKKAGEYFLLALLMLALGAVGGIKTTVQ